MSIDDLRQRLSDIDRQIIALVGERLNLAGQIGDLKRNAKQPTRDFQREKTVLDLARDAAVGAGVPADLATKLMETLIQGSLTNQEQARVRAEGRGRGQRALVIGGAGRMGRWFVDFLDSQGFQVDVADPATDGEGATFADWQSAPDDYELTVLAAPIRATADILETMADSGRSGLVFDIGSLKSPLIPGLQKLAEHGVRVTSVHPMFGPDTELLSGRHVLFMDAGQAEATAEARDLFSSTMAAQIQMSLEEHDRLVAWVLGLSHALNVAFFTALAESGEAAPRLSDMSSTTFDAQLDLASGVADENPRLYFEIQALNPYGVSPLDSLCRAVSTVADAVRAGDEEAFCRLMEQGQGYFQAQN